MTTKTTKPEAEGKSAADLLIEMQLKRELEKETNPLQIVSHETLDGKEKNESGSSIVERKTYANGVVMESYA